MRTSTKLKFSIPEQDDQVDVSVLGTAFDALDQAAGDALPTNGDSSSTTAAFTQASERANIVSGEKLGTLFGKIMKFFADLKKVAFSGSYNDLSDTPDEEVDLRLLEFEDHTTTFNDDGSITKTFGDKRSIKTVFTDSGMTKTLYAANGTTVVKTLTITFNTDGSITAATA